jgi:hypothetical protein
VIIGRFMRMFWWGRNRWVYLLIKCFFGYGIRNDIIEFFGMRLPLACVFWGILVSAGET